MAAWTDEQRAKHARKRKLWWDSRTAEQKKAHGVLTCAKARARKAEEEKRALEEKKTDS